MVGFLHFRNELSDADPQAVQSPYALRKRRCSRTCALPPPEAGIPRRVLPCLRTTEGIISTSRAPFSLRPPEAGTSRVNSGLCCRRRDVRGSLASGVLRLRKTEAICRAPFFFSSQEADPRSITFLINRLTEFQSTVQNSTGRVCPHFLLQSASRTVLAERQGPIRASHRRCDEATRARVHRHTRRAGQAVSDIGFFLF
jgi:hypothetical protein